jgi:hypothetical protein
MKEQKSFAVSKASNLWILSLDADERVSEGMKRFIEREMLNPSHDGYRFPRQNFFLGKWLRHGGWYPDHVLRLFRKDRGHFGGINPHDKVLVDSGRVVTIREHIIHITYKSLSQYVSKQNLYSSISAEEKVKKGVMVISPPLILLKTASKFFEVYIVKKGFLDGFHGFIAAVGATCSAFFKYAKIWEILKSDKETSG